MMQKNKRLLLFAVASFCFLSAIQYSYLHKRSLYSNVSEKAHTLSIASLATIKQIPSLGFRNIVAGWSFIQFLQYFGDDTARRLNGYDDSAKYLSVAVHHDPYFRDFYIFVSGSTTLYAGNPRESIRIMAEGLSQMNKTRAPNNYYVWRYKGTDELLFLNDSKAAQKSFEMAAKWANESDDDAAESIAHLSKQTADFLKDNPGSKLAQINAWGSILTTAFDSTTRNRAISKIRELGGDISFTENGQLTIEYSRPENISKE